MSPADDAKDYKAGISVAWCWECGKSSSAYGEAAAPVVHAPNCSVPKRKYTGRVTAVDEPTGTITISGDGDGSG